MKRDQEASKEAALRPDEPVARRPDVTEPREVPDGETSDVSEGDVEQGRGRDYVEEEWAREIQGQRPRHLPRDELGGVSEHSVRGAGGGIRTADVTEQPGGPPRREPLAVEPEDMGRALLEDATQQGSKGRVDVAREADRVQVAAEGGGLTGEDVAVGGGAEAGEREARGEEGAGKKVSRIPSILP